MRAPPDGRSVVEFVDRTVSDGVPVAERVAIFDNDGTLWCEKPLPIQADFILRRLSEMAQADPGEAKSDAFLRTAKHTTLRRGYLQCAYLPLIELLSYLDANGFSNYIASGGGRDFMRPISQDVYGIPRERVIGSATTFQYTANDHGGTITHKAEADYLNDGPQKPIQIWSRSGRRQFQRRHTDARDHLARGQAVPSPTAPPRRRPARVPLHQRRRAGAGPGPAGRLDDRQHEERLGHHLLTSICAARVSRCRALALRCARR